MKRVKKKVELEIQADSEEFIDMTSDDTAPVDVAPGDVAIADAAGVVGEDQPAVADQVEAEAEVVEPGTDEVVETAAAPEAEAAPVVVAVYGAGKPGKSQSAAPAQVPEPAQEPAQVQAPEAPVAQVSKPAPVQAPEPAPVAVVAEAAPVPVVQTPAPAAPPVAVAPVIIPVQSPAPVAAAPVPVAQAPAVPPVPLAPVQPVPSDVTVKMPVFPPPPVSPTTSVTTAVPVEPAKPTKPVRSSERTKAMLFTALTSVIVAVALVAGVIAVGASFFRDHAKPGTAVAGHNVSGFSQAQISNLTSTLIDNYQATLVFNDKQVQATAAELGITFDSDVTVSRVLAAGDSSGVSAYNPFATKNVPLAMSIDQHKLLTFLNQTFIDQSSRSVPANVAYDAEQHTFAVVPSKDGAQADVAAVSQALEDGAGFGSSLTVPTTVELPAITNDTAQTTADAANQHLASPYVLTAGSRSLELPADSIGSWTVFTQDIDKGTITTSIDADKVNADLPAMMADSLTQATVSQQVMVGPSGNALGVQRWGQDGTQVADPAGVTAQVIDALAAGQGLQLPVDITTEEYKTENVPMAPEYLVPNGEKWVEVDRDNFTVTRWEGTTALSTWSVVIGKPSTPTYAGVFHVQYKIADQTMKGVDYEQPHVPWIAYFNGDIALHGNYWVGGVFGRATSHGCVGMPVDLAKVMYDWIEPGTMVVVH